MPAGIVPELVIVLALLIVIGAVGFVALRQRKREELPPVEAGTPTVEEEAPAVEEKVPALEEEIVRPAPSLRDRLAKSRRFLADRLADAFGRGADEETWEDLEAILIQADVGVEMAQRIVGDVKAAARERNATSAEELKGLLSDELVSLFALQDRGLREATGEVTVWLVVGVNGTGKTTTIGKLAADLARREKTVALAAADTFRAAADEQLGIWADRSGASIVKHQPGADPGAVAFDALQHARARSIDFLIVDTAGRLHTKTPLMEELSKVRRVIEKESDVHEALLVIDATAGQNGLNQAREFAEAAGVSGVVLTKLDGTAKGGIALAIEHNLGIPIKLLGVGESTDDLQPFDPKAYVDALLT